MSSKTFYTKSRIIKLKKGYIFSFKVMQRPAALEATNLVTTEIRIMTFCLLTVMVLSDSEVIYVLYVPKTTLNWMAISVDVMHK